MHMIKVENVSMRFKKREVLENINFTVEPGTKVGIVGDSGSGKSTLARLITGLAIPTKGQIYLNGVKTTEYRRKEKSKVVQMIFQHPQSSFDGKRKIGYQLEEVGRIHNRDYLEEIKRLLNTFLVDDKLMDRYPYQISGGEAQRLSIIRCLLLKPKVLILDEPTSMLDVSVQAEIIDFLLSVQKLEKMTFVFVSHDIELVSHVCDKIIIIDNKQIIEEGTIEEVIEQPKSTYTKNLIESFEYFY
ncbi:hypothetical protein AN1V17_18650 [Vallitalea sediminicola]